MPTVPDGLELLRTLRGHQDVVLRIAWSTDGKWLGSPSVDRTARAWDVTAGDLVGTLHGHAQGVNHIAWSPDMRVVATCSHDTTIRLYNGRTFEHLRTFTEHTGDVNSVAWSCDGAALASGSDDLMFRVWDLATMQSRVTDNVKGVRVSAHPTTPQLFAVAGARRIFAIGPDTQVSARRPRGSLTTCAWEPGGKRLAVSGDPGVIRIMRVGDSALEEVVALEGHAAWVTDVSFSADGRLLASKALDDTVRLWSTDTWQTVAVLEEANSNFWPPGIAFHPTEAVLATLGDEDRSVRIWRVDVDRLAGKSSRASFYSNAKAVLVGDSGVGKSGLALVLTGQPFAPTESTHARHVYTFDLSRSVDSDAEEVREIVLWDLAGQPSYRLLHQLSLREVAVAVVVFDSRSETDPLAGVEHWCRALQQAETAQGRNVGAPIRKLLVAARTDRGGISLSEERIEAIRRQYGFDAWLETSAKTALNIAELAEAIRRAVDWSAMPKASSDDLFRRIKTFLVSEKESGHILETSDSLFLTFLQTGPEHTAQLRDQFHTCIGLLEAQGLVRLLSFGGLVLLQPELLDVYAAWVLEAAKREPEGLGSIAEGQVLTAEFQMTSAERLADRQVESLLLHAVVEDLLRHEIALREHVDDAAVLIFPSQFRRDWKEAPDPPGKAVIFRFEGPLQSIYATMAVRLARSGLFERAEMWRNAALFRSIGTGGNCGIYLRQADEASAELTLFFDADASAETRFVFEHYVHQHLQRRAVPKRITRTRIFVCGDCGAEMNPVHVRRRIQLGKDSMTCPVCERPVLLTDPGERTEAGAELQQMNRAADTARDAEAAESVVRAKEHVEEFDVFLSYSRNDGAAVERIARDLKAHGLRPWLDIWQVEPGARWHDKMQEQIEHVRCAAIIIGPGGEGRIQAMEREALIVELAERKLKLIPVLLPGTKGIPDVPLLLRGHNWVDFRKETPDPFQLLLWGITGRRVAF